jgi:hypothetical protein
LNLRLGKNRRHTINLFQPDQTVEGFVDLCYSEALEPWVEGLLKLRDLKHDRITQHLGVEFQNCYDQMQILAGISESKCTKYS